VQITIGDLMKKFLLIFAIFVLLVIVFHAPILEGFARWLIVQDKLEKADAIVVLAGDSNGERVAQGVELYKKGYAKFILMSGGPVMWKETYAENMRRQARSLGIPDKDILVQAQSESTYEDARFSYTILKERNVRSIILVTSPFHSRRAMRTAKRVFGKEIRIISYPVQNSRSRAEGWWTRHEDTQTIVWELEAMIFYALKGL
jgi:uncharacterized SAM-binding protein YcdF (DUF218 family)